MTQTTTLPRPARTPPLTPLAHRTTRIRLLLNTYLDVIDERHTPRDTAGKPSSRMLRHDPLWRDGSYERLDQALDELRQHSKTGTHRGVYNCLWAVHIARSQRHLKRRAPKAQVGLDWLTARLTEPVYVPTEISMNAGYDRADALAWATAAERAQLREAS